MRGKDIQCFNIFAGEVPTVYYAAKSGSHYRVVVLSEGERSSFKLGSEKGWVEKKGTGLFLAIGTAPLRPYKLLYELITPHARPHFLSSREIVSTWEEYEAERAAEQAEKSRRYAAEDKRTRQELDLIDRANKKGLPVKRIGREAVISWPELQAWVQYQEKHPPKP